MRLLCVAFLIIPSTLLSQPASERLAVPVESIMYGWKSPTGESVNGIRTINILEGTAHDFSFLAVDACEVLPSKRSARSVFQVPLDEERVMMIKTGRLDISFGDSTWSIGPGSVALLMPGQRYVITRLTPASFYMMRYRSKAQVDHERGFDAGGSIVCDWTKLSFREHSRGGVRSYFNRPTAMCRRFEMHVTTLKPGLKSHDPHTHGPEEIILMLEDQGGDARTEMLVGDNTFEGGAGDLYYVGTDLLHGIKNIGSTKCSYFAFQFD